MPPCKREPAGEAAEHHVGQEERDREAPTSSHHLETVCEQRRPEEAAPGSQEEVEGPLEDRSGDLSNICRAFTLAENDLGETASHGDLTV